ncbi:MAG: STAS/SEC14 domain-containing protein [Sulfurospirillaceae bacterium]|nr:STAS/SEC14 domain-containing protein [Sulfurospirillaceae bacterium]MDD2826253.1 STAS/SEC14 domain-containing protein [Sulfurospirillaceae bacterium]
MKTKVLHFELKGLGESFYCYIKVNGTLTHEDYATFVPLFEKSLKDIKEPKVKMLVDITDLDGWELEAAWDDIKFGLQHDSVFDKIAVVGKSALYTYGVKISNWFTPYEMHYFEDIDEAKKWLDVQ